MAQRFCVLTTGRTGSNALFSALGNHADIATPVLATGRRHPELLHPHVVDQYRTLLADQVGRALPTHDDVADGFYSANADRPYAGFKLMPWQHSGYAAFVSRQDIRFIVLRRLDLVSMVASFFVARRFGTWDLGSQKVVTQWTFGRDHAPAVRQHLRFLVRNEYLLGLVANAIPLTYEDLCRPDFRSEPLDDFFGRHIGIDQPKPPTHASAYIRNWDEFKAFVETARRRLQLMGARLPDSGPEGAEDAGGT